jgi:hypothetical protein
VRLEKWDGERKRGEDVPAQFTSEEGAERDLYACHNNEAVFERLLDPVLSVMRTGTREIFT